MSTAATHLPPALKHGAYSTATLLPGEDKAEFDRLHQSLIAELEPVGALEEHIVANVARFVWRRDHLDILRVTKLIESRVWTLVKDRLMAGIAAGSDDIDARRAEAEAEAREELGEICDLTKIDATDSRLANEIETRARLDEMIDKGLKRLLFLRGLKSVARPAPAARIAPTAADQAAATNGQAVHAAG